MVRYKYVNLLIFNAHSVRPRKKEIIDFLVTNDIHIALINETFLDSSETFYVRGYRVYRLDRSGPHRGGGVAIIIKLSIDHDLLPCPQTDIIEALSIKVKGQNSATVITCVYFPGTNVREELDQFRSDLQLLSSLAPNHICAGDLNSRHRYWGCLNENSAGKILFDEMSRGVFTVNYPDSPTHYPENGGNPSTLDLILSCGGPLVSSISVVSDLSSDHLPVISSIGLDMTLVDAPIRVRDLGGANWNVYTEAVRQGINQMTSPTTIEDIDNSINLFSQVICEAENTSVPFKTIQPGRFVLPYYVKRLKGIRNAMNRRWQRETDPRQKQYLKDARNELTRLVDDEITKLTNRKFSQTLEKLNSEPGPNRKKLWRLSRNLKIRSNQTPMLMIDGKKLITSQEKAEAFANHYQSVHDRDLDLPSSSLSRRVNESVERIKVAQISIEDVPQLTTNDTSKIIQGLRTKKAPGPDCVSNLLLKKLPSEGQQYLTNIFNTCLRLGYFPKAWKESKTIAVRKGNKPANQVASYRPISLLSSIGKIFERAVIPWIVGHIDDNQLLPRFQYGFRAGRSSTHQLYRVTGMVKKALKNKKSVGILSLDLQSAFDTVWHHGVLHKLETANFPLYLLKLFESYLSDRYFMVAVGNQMSSKRLINAGVPQGAVWSPIIFNLYIADFPTVNSVQNGQFADDNALIAESHRTSTIINRLQQATNRVVRYCKKWRLKINGNKSEAVLFSRKRAHRHRPHSKIVVDGAEIEWNQSMKYLGMTLDKLLTYRSHTDEVLRKGHRLIRALYPLICRKSRLCLEFKLIVFKSIFRPTICYACPVWCVCAATHRQRLQRLQNKILKMIMNVPWFTRTSTVHDFTGVELLWDYIQKLRDTFDLRCSMSVDDDISEILNVFPR